jgi:hypothetical protein
MSPMMLALGAALLAGLIWAASDQRAARVAAALALALVGGGLWWGGTQGGQHAIKVEAQSAAGRPVISQVLVKGTDGRRDAIAVPFTRSIPAEMPLLLMLGLGLLGAGAARNTSVSLATTAGAVGMAGWAATLYNGASGALEGEAAARAQLTAALPDLEVLQFTVPEAWSFTAQAGLWATGGAALFGLLCLAVGGRLKTAGLSARLTAVAAALAAGACIWQVLQMGGLPWRGTEGCLLAVAICTGAAWNLREGWAGALCGIGVAAALVGLG